MICPHPLTIAGHLEDLIRLATCYTGFIGYFRPCPKYLVSHMRIHAEVAVIYTNSEYAEWQDGYPKEWQIPEFRKCVLKLVSDLRQTMEKMWLET
jgi:hypothetical protein